MKAPLRVLMSADAVGGVFAYALDAARGLKRHRVETVIAVLGPSLSSSQREAVEAADLAIVETGLPLDWTARTEGQVSAAGVALAALAADAGVDLVHLNAPALAAQATFPAPVVTVAHSCVATWWDAVRGDLLPADFAWRAEMTRLGYVKSRAVLAPTLAFAEATARRYGLESLPLVVPNGRRPVPAPRRPVENSVFTAGRLWDEGKNVATLDRAAARLSVPLSAAGPLTGPNGAAVTLSAARPIGILSETQIAHALAARPIFASAALYEPFGLAVLEAAQAGCALVLSDIPTFRELWSDAALFVPARDHEGFASAIGGLLADPARRADLGAAARLRAERYSVEAMCAALAHVYSAILAKRARESAAA